jgi:cytoskeletal protein RodZ
MSTTGEKLRLEREAQGISLEKVVQETNIRIQFLRAIEDGKTDVLASPAQTRGFTRLYASFLGLDPQAIFEIEAASKNTIPETNISAEEYSPEETPVKEKSKRKLALFPKAEKIPENADPRERFRDLLPQPNEKKLSTLIFKEIGEELRNQREALGLSLVDVERLTKIRELYLYNLERGAIDELPSTVQGRGMLSNYSNFLSIDPTPLQNRFAEGLQQKRLESAAVALTSIDGKATKPPKSPITGWRRFVTMDLLIGSSVFIILFVLVIWGAIQVIGITQSQAEPTISSISDVLINPPTETPITETITPGAGSLTEQSGLVVNTVSVDILATITSVNTGSIQLVIVGLQRTYLKVIADGKEVFNGRVVPGNVYTFTGSVKVTVDAGSAAGIQIYYNQQDLGVLGMVGETVALEFTSKGYVTPTPRFTASPTTTLQPTLTQKPTNTPSPTPTKPTATITPLNPTPNP